jgi:hypothetical protein
MVAGLERLIAHQLPTRSRRQFRFNDHGGEGAISALSWRFLPLGGLASPVERATASHGTRTWPALA